MVQIYSFDDMSSVLSGCAMVHQTFERPTTESVAHDDSITVHEIMKTGNLIILCR